MEVWRFCSAMLKAVLLAGLVTWTLVAPLAWILRDGLAVGMVETTGVQAAVKFAGLWGLLALGMAVALGALWLVDQWLAGAEHVEG